MSRGEILRSNHQLFGAEEIERWDKTQGDVAKQNCQS